MDKYIFTLINKGDKLDLTTKSAEIKEAVEYINNGKRRHSPVFVGVRIENIEKIDKYNFILAVDVEAEANDSWRQNIGKFLANKADMRNYCNKNDESHMFQVNKI